METVALLLRELLPNSPWKEIGEKVRNENRGDV